MTTIFYNITVTTANSETQFEGNILMTGETSAFISRLLPNQEYMISVQATAINTTQSLFCGIGTYPILSFTTPSRPIQQDSSEYNNLSTNFV